MSTTEEEQLFRVIIVGDTGVGKSCILMRFSEDKFNENHDVTIGVEFGTRSLKVNNQTIKLQIWDTAGQESFRSITRSFYRRADGVLLVYDVTARHTFENCTHWMQEIRQNGNEDVIIYLVGNQVDLIESGQSSEVLTKDAESFVKQHNLSGYIETSAKSGMNVEKAFSEFCKILVQKWKERQENDPTPKPQVVNLNQQVKKSKKCC
jgi:Ras-related protein Rab-2A